MSKDDFYTPTDIDTLRMENELLAYEVRFLKARQSSTQELQRELESANQQLEDIQRQEEEVSELKHQLQESQTELQRKSEETSILETQIQERDAELRERENEVSRLKNQLSEKERRISELGEEVERKSHEVTVLTRWMERMSTTTSALLSSRRWKSGNLIGDLTRKVLLKSPDPSPADAIEGVNREFRAWEKDRTGHPGEDGGESEFRER